MLKKTLVFALKSFRKTPFLNAINILSLTLGLSVFFLISLFLYQEKTYERDFSKRDNIHLIATQFYNMGDLAWTTTNLQQVLNEVPAIEEFTQFDVRGSNKIRTENAEFEGQRVLLVDSLFFKVFDFDLIAGSPSKSLNASGKVVINESTAMTMFGTLDVIGKIIYRGNDDKPLVIDGISRAPHFKTQLNFDLVVAKEYTKGIDDRLWGSIGSHTYAVINPNSTKEAVDEQLQLLVEKYIYPVVSKDIPDIGPFEEWKNESSYLGLTAEPLLSLRSGSEIKNLITPQLNVSQFNTLAIVGIAALLISILNFVNISTSKASVRTREVAVKRILGSSRNQLVLQFIVESFIQVALASLLALGIVETLVNLSPGFMSGMVEYSVIHSSEWMIGLVVFVIGLTLFSGIYPAVYLSSGRILGLLKGTSEKSFSILNGAMFRKIATVVQFMLSIALIAGVITMFQQLNHLRDRDLGYESGNVFVIDNTFRLKESNETFREELIRQPFVQIATYADHFPNQQDIVVLDYMIKDENEVEHPFIRYRTDPDFFDAMQMEFVQGGPFKKFKRPEGDVDPSTFRYEVVINETAARALGLEEPIGKVINDNLRIVGVVNDFVFSELRDGISPVIISQRDRRPYYKLAVRMAPGNFDIQKIQEVWDQFNQEKMAWYELSSNYNSLVAEENKTFNAVLTFSILTIIISCLGLFGLAVFTIDQRIKEFGIRKVLGASILDVMKLFSWDFIKLILIAFVIASPIAIYGLNGWLNEFADRVALSPVVFILTAVITVFVVLVTIGVQSFKAGQLNPVDTLRDE